MSLRLGIDGFGRIGRRVFRAAVRNFANDIEVVGINDLLGPDSGLTCCAYISTGGGAFEVLEGKTLPAFEILQKRAR